MVKTCPLPATLTPHANPNKSSFAVRLKCMNAHRERLLRCQSVSGLKPKQRRVVCVCDAVCLLVEHFLGLVLKVHLRALNPARDTHHWWLVQGQSQSHWLSLFSSSVPHRHCLIREPQRGLTFYQKHVFTSLKKCQFVLYTVQGNITLHSTTLHLLFSIT